MVITHGITYGDTMLIPWSSQVPLGANPIPSSPGRCERRRWRGPLGPRGDLLRAWDDCTWGLTDTNLVVPSNKMVIWWFP